MAKMTCNECDKIDCKVLGENGIASTCLRGAKHTHKQLHKRISQNNTKRISPKWPSCLTKGCDYLVNTDESFAGEDAKWLT